MALGQLSSLVRDFKIGAAPVTILFWILPTLQFAVRLDRVLDGLSRPFVGWISDQIGRENTIVSAYTPCSPSFVPVPAMTNVAHMTQNVDSGG